ncbi:MAG: sugar ABC transporter substrate-binding protein [Anaerolineae bacterium]|nr:sugar ABC transporter substrate-binding protein [Anaerolineae bacterium]
MDWGDLLEASQKTLSLIWLVVWLLFSAFISGCGLMAAPTAEIDPVTITFVYPAVDEGYYEPLVQQFNQSYPHLTVELKRVPFDRLDDLAPDEADIFLVYDYLVYQMKQEGDILDLSPFIEQDDVFDQADFYPGTVEMLSSEGKQWSIPAGVDVGVMYYNRDLFDQAGIPYPGLNWTWDDFLNSAVAVSNPEAGIYGYITTGSTMDPSYFDAIFFVYQHGGKIVDDLQSPTRPTLNDPLTIEALEWYTKLYTEYDAAPTPLEARKAFRGNPQYALYEGLRNGKAGMWIGVLSDRGGLTWPIEWFVNWGMAPLPRDAQAITQVSVEGYVISSQTENIEASWQWISFLSGQMPGRLMPPRRSLAASAAYEQQMGKEIAAVTRASMESAVVVSPEVGEELNDIIDIFGQAVDDMVNERFSPIDALNWAQQEAELKMGQ